MYDLLCKHCHAAITEYRGSWFSRGDESRCHWNGDRYHAPVPHDLMRKYVRSMTKALTKAEVDAIVADEYGAKH